MNADFGAKRATFKELYLKKEGKFGLLFFIFTFTFTDCWTLFN